LHPTLKEAQSKYTESEKEKTTARRFDTSNQENAQYYRKLHRAEGAMHSISTKDDPVQICVYKGFFFFAR
jgi:hypothetical protein